MLYFNDYHELVAKRNSKATCGDGTHRVAVGDAIGWARRGQVASVICATCWAKWKSEVEEEDRILGVAMSSPDSPY